MQISIVLVLLLFQNYIFSQSNLQIFTHKAYFTPSVVSSCPFFDLKNCTFQLSSVLSNTPNEFSIYNKNTKFNDFYGVKKDTFYYIKSVIITQNTIYSPHIDSFNPDGASDYGAAVLAGLINTIVGKF
jgi:hypothetical protein